MRNDIRGVTRAPSYIQRWLTQAYGTTPYGEPRYRLVWAANRYQQSGGVWLDWDDSVPAEFRNGDLASPTRRVLQMRWMPKYDRAATHWIIERWMPPSFYGDTETWYSPHECGGTVLWTPQGSIAMLGDFPWQGDYEDIGAQIPWPVQPTIHLVSTAIDYSNLVRNSAPSLLGRIRARVSEAVSENEARERRAKAADMDIVQDASPAFGFNPHVGYGGTQRSSLVETCNKLGINAHPF